MLHLKIVCLAALGFVLLFVLPSLGSRSIGDPNTYATSDSSNETIIDEPQPGTIMVTKRVINEGGGSARPSDFTITVAGNNPTPSSFDGSSSGTTVTLEPGRYSVTENSLPDYTSSSSDRHQHDCIGS